MGWGEPQLTPKQKQFVADVERHLDQFRLEEELATDSNGLTLLGSGRTLDDLPSRRRNS